MFRTKLEVDRHVEKCLKRINNDRERKLRGLPFAKLYYNVGELDVASRYLMSYLTANPFSAEAYALHGKCMQKLGKKDAAIDAYRSSLHIEPKQNDIILKVCELLASEDVSLDKSCAQHYCDKAQAFDPHNPIVLSLKQRLIASESGNSEDITKFILNELNQRPKDIQLRIRLLRHLLDHNDVAQAYKHTSEIELKHINLFTNNFQWYDIVFEVLTRYQREVAMDKDLTWKFFMLFTTVLDRLSSLGLDEHCPSRGSLQSINTVFKLDQTLKIAIDKLEACPIRPLVDEFTNHFRAQLCYHLLILILKQGKRAQIKYKYAVNSTLPLMFAAYNTRPTDIDAAWLKQTSDENRNLLKRWRREATFRCSQTGHLLLTLSKERKGDLFEQAANYSTGQWREQVFKLAFVSRDQQALIKGSYFVDCQQLSEVTLRIPDSSTLIKYDEEAQLLYPDHLHNLIWICLHSKMSKVTSTAFHSLKYSVKSLNSYGAESLSLLDVDAFVYCATLCAKSRINMDKQVFNQEKVTNLPAPLTDLLCSIEQSKWFTTAYMLDNNEIHSSFTDARLNLIRGIQVVRCVGNHGIHVQILVKLAQIFDERAKNCVKQSEIEFNEARAELYWTTALPLLEKIKDNQIVNYPTNRLFEYKGKEMSDDDVLTYIEEAKLFNGIQLIKKKDFDKALKSLENLQSPYASFYQGQIYQMMADELNDNITSEMRNQRVNLLSNARDCLYLTLDRLRKPGVDRKHPLNSQLGTEIEKVEKLLNSIDPDVVHHEYEVDNGSIGSIEEQTSIYPNLSLFTHSPYTPRFERSLQTPITPRTSRKEARPSPERLDAQIRQMQLSKDATINHILEQNRAVVDSQRAIVEELCSSLTTMFQEVRAIKQNVESLTTIKTTVDELKVAVDDMQSLRDVVNLVNDMKKEIAELRKDTNKIKNTQLSDEDLYVLDDEYGSDYTNLNTNSSSYNPPYYQNQPKLPTAAAVAAAMYPGMYPAYYTGGIPFTDAQLGAFNQPNYAQIPLGQVPMSSILAPPTMQQTPMGVVMPSGMLTSNVPALTTTTKAPPVNVVITSSDPLPKTMTATSQILSVTIPPEHIKGSKSQPHKYQIPMPETTAPTPSIINQPPPTITTQSILSNVAPPLYSAVDKVDKNTGLGLKIEKSLSQTLNTSSNSNASDEHDPCPDFKPIVPLPDEVPVNTGEENEIVLFCERAKLFRYVNKEWRERGVGNLKILRNKETGKVRILMRRDQIHKICANHFITKDMTLKPMSNNDRSFIWAANDFSDGEMLLETLCVKFKTAEEAKKFATSFEEAQNSLTEETKEEEAAVASYGGFKFTSTPTFKPKDIETTPKETTVTDTNKSSPFATFTFGAKNTTTTNLFSSPISTSSEYKPKIEQLDDVSSENAEDFVPNVEFKPVVPLPELVDVKTGEENAEILFESRAKLLRYDSTNKEWKERGLGIMKILKENTIRLLMRRELIHKVCCNHQLLKEMKFTKNPNNKAVTWVAKDFSEGEFKTETLCIRFKTEEQTNAFLKAIENGQDMLDDKSMILAGKKDVIPEIKDSSPLITTNKEDKKAKSSPVEVKQTIGWGDKFKPKHGTWECKNCYIMNEAKANYCAACETPKNNTTPTKPVENKSGPQFSFGVATGTVPSTGFFFGPKPDTESITEQNSDTSTTKSDKESLVSTSATSVGSWGDAFKPKPGSWECAQCLVRNTADKVYCASCEAPKDNTVPPKETNKGIHLETSFNFTFGIPATTAENVTMFGSKSESALQQPKFSFGSSTTSFGFKTAEADSTTSSTVKPFTFALSDSKDKTKEDENKFVFGSPQKHGFEFTPRSPRRQSGGQGDDDESSFVEDEGDHIYFKPVIPLPEKVEVKTGEEGEIVLYCHRAKLYRFVDGEWKERGLGDVKILKDEQSGKLRVVMRREQVLKICLNHSLTKDIEYIHKDEKTWLFTAPDYSEGAINHWQFCIRFKSAEVADEFKKAIDNALSSQSVVEESSELEVEFVSELQVTPEEEAEAIALKLPPKFMAYRQLPDCTCETCKKEDELLAPLFNKSQNTPNTLEKSQSLRSLLVKPSILNLETPKSEKNESSAFKNFSFSVKTETPPANIFGNTTPTPTPTLFSTPSSTTSSIFGGTPTTSASLFGNFKTGNIFGNQTPKENGEKPTTVFSSFSFGGDKVATPPSSVFGALGTKTEVKETQPKEVVLKSDPSLSFANLVDKPSFIVPTTESNKAFSFTGAGTPVFASLNTDKDKKTGVEEGAEGEEEYDPHYEPIVPLPDTIIVSTGEEDETEIFNTRAKLFLYYADSKQWKERGVGQMKILYHPVNNTYRFLLRREQVHKVVLNMLLTNDVVVQPMTTSEKAYLIGGYNFIEGELVLEKLSIMFKNVDLAKEFYAAVQKCLDAIKEMEAKAVPSTVQNFGNESTGEIINSSVTSYDGKEEEDEEDDEDDDEEDDDDDRSVLFLRRCVFSEEINNQWNEIAEGDLQVYYDPDMYGSRITFNDNEGQILSNTLIGKNTQMTLDNDVSCIWKSVEWAYEEPHWRTLKATFDDSNYAREFYDSFLESVQYAQGSNIYDEIPTEQAGADK